MFRESPAIGRLLWGLEEPGLLVTVTFLVHLPPLLPHLHLFSPFPAHPRAGQMLFTEVPFAQNQFHRVPTRIQQPWGLGVQFGGTGADGRGPE